MLHTPYSRPCRSERREWTASVKRTKNKIRDN